MEIYPTFKPKNHEEAIIVWGKVVEKLTNDQIINGIQICSTDLSEFVPPPAKFKLWAYGLLTPEEAYQKACKYRREVKNPVIWHAAANANMFGNYPFSTLTEEEKRFKSSYANICTRFMNGEEFRLPIDEPVRILSVDWNSQPNDNDEIVTDQQIFDRKISPQVKRWHYKLNGMFGADDEHVKEFDELCKLPVNEIKKRTRDKLNAILQDKSLRIRGLVKRS